MSIFDCCSCFFWAGDKVHPEQPRPLGLNSETQYLFESQGFFPGFSGVEIVTYAPPPQARKEPSKLKIMMGPSPTKSSKRQITHLKISRKKVAPLEVKEDRIENRFGGFTTRMAIEGVGDVPRRMAAAGMWNFFETPCTLSTESLKEEFSNKTWTRVTPFDGDRINLITNPSKDGFNGTLSILHIERERKGDPHLKLTACVYQGDKLILDTLKNPFKASIILSESLPSASQTAIKIVEGQFKKSIWTFTYISPQNTYGDFQ